MAEIERRCARGRQVIAAPSAAPSNGAKQKFCGECGAAIRSAARSRRRQRRCARRCPSEAPHLTPPELGPRAPRVARRSQTGRCPFVGRDDDLAWLEEQRARAKRQLCARSRITGEPGVGKTRLLREFARIARSAPATRSSTSGPIPLGRGRLLHAASRDRRARGAAGRRRRARRLDRGERRGALAVSARSSARRMDAERPPRRREQRASRRPRPFAGRFVRANGAHRRAPRHPRHRRSPRVDGASRNALSDVVGRAPARRPCCSSPRTPASTRTGEGVPVRTLAPLQGPAVTSSSPPRARRTSPRSRQAAAAIVPLYVEQMIRFVREHGDSPRRRASPDLIALRVERLHADARRAAAGHRRHGRRLDRGHRPPAASRRRPTCRGAIATLRKAGMVEARRRSAGASRTRCCATSCWRPSRRPRGAISTRRPCDVCEMLAAPLEVRALHEFFAQNSFEALLLLERVSALCAHRGDGAGSVMALRRGLDLARRELFRGELDDPERAVRHLQPQARRGARARSETSRTPTASSARRSTSPAPAGRTARACSARSRTSRTAASAIARPGLPARGARPRHAVRAPTSWSTLLQDLKTAIAV